MNPVITYLDAEIRNLRDVLALRRQQRRSTRPLARLIRGVSRTQMPFVSMPNHACDTRRASLYYTLSDLEGFYDPRLVALLEGLHPNLWEPKGTRDYTSASPNREYLFDGIPGTLAEGVHVQVSAYAAWNSPSCRIETTGFVTIHEPVRRIVCDGMPNGMPNGRPSSTPKALPEGVPA